MLLFADSFSHYATADIGEKWTSVSTGANEAWSIAAEGRYDDCLKKVVSGIAEPGVAIVSPVRTQAGTWTPNTSGICGFAFKIDDLSVLNQSAYYAVYDARCLLLVGEGTAPIICFNITTAGTFELRLMGGIGPNWVLKASSAGGISSGVWHYVELSWTVGASGAAAVRVDGVEVLSFAGNLTPTYNFTPYSWTGVWNRVRCFSMPRDGGAGKDMIFRVCDFYLADQTSPNGSFLGNVRIFPIYPIGAGNAAEWSPLAAANWEEVNEAPPDDDTSYVESDALNQRDSHEFQDITADAVLGLQVVSTAKLTTAGTAEVKPSMRIGGTDYDGEALGLSSTSYATVCHPYDESPDSGVAFTEAEVNAAEFGVLRTS